MEKQSFFAILVLIASTLSQTGYAIQGTAVKNTASSSTCLILKPNGDDTCNGVLISPTEVQTASHCYAYLWHDEREAQVPKVMCGFSDTAGLSFESKIEKQVDVSKTTNFRKDRYLDDQMIIRLQTAAPIADIGRLANAADLQSIFSKHEVDGSYSLATNYTCKIDAHLGPSKTSALSAIIPSEFLRYNLEHSMITLQYPPIEVTTPEKIGLLKDAKDENGKLSSYSSVYRLMKTFPVPVLTHQGDSGSPLYCYRNDSEESKITVGILSRGLNEVKIVSPDHWTLYLGSKWNTPVDLGAMKSDTIEKRSIMQKRALNEAAEIEFSSF